MHIQNHASNVQLSFAAEVVPTSSGHPSVQKKWGTTGQQRFPMVSLYNDIYIYNGINGLLLRSTHFSRNTRSFHAFRDAKKLWHRSNVWVISTFWISQFAWCPSILTWVPKSSVRKSKHKKSLLFIASHLFCRGSSSTSCQGPEEKHTVLRLDPGGGSVSSKLGLLSFIETGVQPQI